MLNYQTVDFMAGQLADQYATQRQAGYSYKNEEDLPKFFRAQAAKLAANGVTSIYDVQQSDGGLVNSVTGEPIKKVELKPDWETNPEAFRVKNPVSLEDRGKFTRWGIDYSVDGQADYGISFENGIPVYTPFWKDTATKILGMDLEDAVKTAIAATALYHGGSALLSSGGATGAGAGTGTAIVGTPGVSTIYPVAAPSVGVSTLAPQVAGAATGISLLEGAQFPVEGLKAAASTAPGATAPFATSTAATGFQASAIPTAAGMGIGQGLTVPVSGGTITGGGLIPTGAPVPLGGGPERGLLDNLRTANAVRNMLTQPTVQQQAGLLGGGQASQPRGVDFSPLYQNSMVGLLPLAERYRRSLI